MDEPTEPPPPPPPSILGIDISVVSLALTRSHISSCVQPWVLHVGFADFVPVAIHLAGDAAVHRPFLGGTGAGTFSIVSGNGIGPEVVLAHLVGRGGSTLRASVVVRQFDPAQQQYVEHSRGQTADVASPPALYRVDGAAMPSRLRVFGGPAILAAFPAVHVPLTTPRGAACGHVRLAVAVVDVAKVTNRRRVAATGRLVPEWRRPDALAPVDDAADKEEEEKVEDAGARGVGQQDILPIPLFPVAEEAAPVVAPIEEEQQEELSPEQSPCAEEMDTTRDQDNDNDDDNDDIDEHDDDNDDDDDDGGSDTPRAAAGDAARRRLLRLLREEDDEAYGCEDGSPSSSVDTDIEDFLAGVQERRLLDQVARQQRLKDEEAARQERRREERCAQLGRLEMLQQRVAQGEPPTVTAVSAPSSSSVKARAAPPAPPASDRAFPVSLRAGPTRTSVTRVATQRSALRESAWRANVQAFTHGGNPVAQTGRLGGAGLQVPSDRDVNRAREVRKAGTVDAAGRPLAVAAPKPIPTAAQRALPPPRPHRRSTAAQPLSPEASALEDQLAAAEMQPRMVSRVSVVQRLR